MTGNENPGAAGGRQAGVDTQQISTQVDSTENTEPPQESRPDFAVLVSIPALSELASRRQWCVWRKEERGGKSTKVPYISDGRGKRLDTTDPEDWSDLKAAVDGADNYDGVGFIFSKADPYVGVDLDTCCGDDGELEPWAREIIDALDSYTEFSPSGRGVHIICRGKLPENSRHRKGQIEVYDAGRYFTVTGWHVVGTPVEIRDATAALISIVGQMDSSHVAHETTGATDLKNLTRQFSQFVRADAKAPGDKLSALLENCDPFSRSWNRSDSRDDWSDSEFDLSIASYLVRAQWTDEEIVAALIEHRRMHGGTPKLRSDYYVRTIAKVRKSVQPRDETTALTEFDFADLIDRAKSDDGAAFESDAIAALAGLRVNDRAEYERVRAGLKGAGVRLGSLDDAINSANGNECRGERETHAQTLAKLALSNCEPFHNAEGNCFADMQVGGHRETWPIRSRSFKLWIAKLFFDATKGAPASDAMQSALNVIESHARFNGAEREVHVRIASQGERCVYVDMCDESWRAIEIDADGWRIVAESPVRFRRAKGMLSLPVPERGGTVEQLDGFINTVSKSDDLILVVAWLIAAFRGEGPYAILATKGEHGAAKSTTTRLARHLIDPNTAPLRSLPREDRDLFVAASNGFVLAFDNISQLPSWLSDSLCRIATGGGFATRELYSDGEEAIFNATRPIVLNGIEDFVTRPDLADRVIEITLATIPDEKRKPEALLWAEFERVRPQILGALLDAVSHGLANVANVRLARLPRMADFARWVVACEGALPWPRGTFMRAYDANRSAILALTMEGDAVASEVRALMVNRSDWSGTAKELLVELNRQNGEASRDKNWPQTPRALSGRIRRAAPGLRRLGIEVEFNRTGAKGTRTIRLGNAEEVAAGE